MKFLLFSDLHAKNHRAGATTLADGTNSRLADTLGILDQVYEVAVSQGVYAIFFLGDLFHSRTLLDADVVHHLYRRICKIGKAFPLYLIKGNHDSYDNAGTIFSSIIFSEVSVVVSDPLTVSCGGQSITMIPWISNAKEYYQKLKASNARGDLLLIHQGVEEGRVGPNGKQVHAAIGLNDLPLEGFRRVFAGDYHARQEMAEGRFQYLGSPMQLNFGERGEGKFLTIWDSDNDTVQLIPTNAPKFFVYDSVDELRSAREANQFDHTRDFVRLRVKSSDREAAEALGTSIATNLDFEMVKETVAEDRCDPRVVESDFNLLREYVSQQEGVEDVDMLVAAGMETLNPE